MDIIHDPRLYTKHQKNLMEAIVRYIWGTSRSDIKMASNELTEDISMLGELAPDVDSLPEPSRQALIFYGQVQIGLLHDVKQTGKGYELLAVWMDAVYDYAYHMGQLPERN